MAKLRVTIIDEVRNRRLKVDLPNDAAMEKLLPALANKLGLPATAPGGQPTAYRLTHEATGRALGGDQTLASFGVGEGDALRLATEKAVPTWQKVPVWGWGAIGGVVLLIAVVGAFLAGRGAKPVPTPTVVAEATTPAATSTAVPRPTATSIAPTFTALPPTTDTPVPTSTPRPTATPVPLTDTPAPTATPQPTPTPSPTMDADPTVYDNFNNPANDGSYNKSLWEPWGWGQTGQVAQQNGILIVTQDSEIPGDCTRLAAYRKRFSTLSVPTFFEAKLMVSPDKFDGNMGLFLCADLPGGEGWFSNCGIGGYDGAYCNDTAWPKQEGHWYDVLGSKPVDLGTWHTFRIEVDPATMTFTYYMDGQMVDSHVPVDAEKLKKARFTLVMGVCEKQITGYIDDVRIGPVQ